MRARPIARAVARCWPALAVWGVGAVTIFTTCAASGYRPFASATWSRFDSALYLNVAQHGYTLFRCARTPSQWCGNSGWFPVYPWFVAGLHQTGLPLGASAVVISWSFGAGTLVLLWWTFLDRRVTLAALGALAYAAFAPGQVYDFAIFPLSMLAFWTVAHLWLLIRGRWVAAGLVGALAALTYPIGLMVIVSATVWLLVALREEPVSQRIRRVVVVSGLSLLGPAILVLVQRVQVGRWNAYFLVQAKYPHALRNPLSQVVGAAHELKQGSPFAIGNAPAVQTLLVAFVLACVLVEFALRRRSTQRADLLLILWAVASWILPHATAYVELPRSQAVLLPLAVLVRRLPRPLIVVIVIVAASLTVPMAQLFLNLTLD